VNHEVGLRAPICAIADDPTRVHVHGGDGGLCAVADVFEFSATRTTRLSILSFVHVGIGSPRLSQASDTYDNGLSHEAADPLLAKYPG